MYLIYCSHCRVKRQFLKNQTNDIRHSKAKAL
ncbi:hypothetical protein HGG82_08210 [Marinomonas sp. M1K-6]|uniref:Uncharacterized protein n=1 Tax=Marinomonas profundi TaxID=2726122 RepID=A0A847R1I5_9GAMM|nr:hypothetical protein [Marinomonas profundi]UDV02172.1 hypothetical protein J8N69_11270 [Marinomonas profundi]